MSTLKNIFTGSVWGIIAKVFDAIAKFVTIPMLVGFYGKQDYGLIALTFSLNAYLRLMDLGMNVGSIRFFSIWLSNNEIEKIGKVSRSSIVFYGIIGLINALIFIVMADYGVEMFNVERDQILLYQNMMYVLAISTVLNWLSNVVTQLLSAHNELGWVNKVTFLSSLFNFLTAFIAIKVGLSMNTYFFMYTLSTLIGLPLNIYRLRVYNIPLSQLLFPKWDGKAFKEILGYSMAIFLMGIFQVTANNLRPLLLGKFSSKGIEVLTEYRVMQTIVMLILAFGGVFMQVLLPSTSKVYAEKDQVKLEKIIYDGTKYISIFFSFVVFVIISSSQPLLKIYMGDAYTYLSLWLTVWLITVLISMHNAPVASLVLSTGKTKFLVYSSGISCILSLPITIILAKELNVGSAVIGYLFYVVLQLLFYYIYYIPKILNLKSLKIFFSCFGPTALIGFLSWGCVIGMNEIYVIPNALLNMLVNTILFSSVFLIIHVCFIIKFKDLTGILYKIRRK
ncbi:MAG: hypothetical protein QHC79_04035 [Pseudosphingobacterium sp.]|nr:hypothetical protein [Olivibacter sp. UJ_SKK_5.1]MDX3912683.1 hypothetical protein [Pseudosphingobacterium sp.]